ncbi:class I SAM-dependent methyltransferase [Kribbella qitaiheensis]|uniref:Class I SAM-dependent methyltransferase n=1 Tax=Kribbella qitaiheensis TaxID=1544730 RepID=A0A7G6X0W7_9ACTN|nr:class I SAM-dependent methyltransferase [Kribbella qitaiheensis]QNE19882.1 class I SAM-dependent methyltransferase [Kribbella qitaiheensis]
MSSEDWQADTRISYDTVAGSYAEMVRGLLDETPYERAALELFARQVGGGVVADVGCGPGRITGYLRGLGVDAFGIDLSPAMIDIARREFPGVRFEVGSMTELEVADASLSGLVAWYSLIHVPDEEIGAVLAHLRRVLRPGSPLLLGFHVGDETQLKTQGYGGHAMKVYVHLRQPEQLAAWLEEAGFTVEMQMTLSSAESRRGAILFAR